MNESNRWPSRRRDQRLPELQGHRRGRVEFLGGLCTVEVSKFPGGVFEECAKAEPRSEHGGLRLEFYKRTLVKKI